METGHPTQDGSARLLRGTGAVLARAIVAAVVVLALEPIGATAAGVECLPPGPQIILQPQDVTVTVGERAVFRALAEGEPPLLVHWQVSTEGGAKPQPVGIHAETLTIENTSVAQDGWEYRAVFENGTSCTAKSEWAKLTVDVPPAVTTLAVSAPPPPAASFAWFPAAPFVGEPVSFASISTDAASPITALAWDLAGNGPLIGGGSVVSTSFSSPGAHVVRLRVTDANGLSSIVAETIPVSPAPPTLLQPFPIVRLAGFDTSYGVHLVVFTVLAPVSARITITCRGHGCPTKVEHRLAASRRNKRKTGSLLIAFPRFERSLRAGITVEVRVFKPEQIGAYTKLVIRRGRLPTRVDACLNPANSMPMACPSS